jgi:hypothetical protein
MAEMDARPRPDSVEHRVTTAAAHGHVALGAWSCHLSAVMPGAKGPSVRLTFGADVRHLGGEVHLVDQLDAKVGRRPALPVGPCRSAIYFPDAWVVGDWVCVAHLMAKLCRSCGKRLPSERDITFSLPYIGLTWDPKLCQDCNLNSVLGARSVSSDERSSQGSVEVLEVADSSSTMLSAATPAIDLSDARFVEIRPSAEISEETLHVETRDFDNRGTSSTSVETFLVRQSHKIEVKLQYDQTISNSLKGELKLFGVLGAAQDISDQIRRSCSLDRASELTIEQTTAINVPARTLVRVEIHWKLVFGHGACVVEVSGNTLNVPYSVTKRLRFDKKVHDVI